MSDTQAQEAARLAEWLRQNSSGIYRPAAEAADGLPLSAEFDGITKTGGGV